MTQTVTPQALKAMLQDGQELALLDVRENGQFGQLHLLFAVNLPLSQLELRMAALVPRPNTRIVLCDAGEASDLARRAAQRLEGFGYTHVGVLQGGIAGWKAAGYVLFSGVNVPSKAFGEYIEHQCHTPSITAQELAALKEQGRPLVILDSRPLDEYTVMAIPGGIDVPGAELVYRVADLAPDPQTLVVVNCAGRTRSIIGAQSLINAGIPNRVVALRNGTMGWHLAGLQVERGAARRAPEPSAAGLAQAKAAAARVAKRFGVKALDAQTAGSTVAQWRQQPGRTTYLLDVRSPEEFLAGHLPSARSAPGGQLVQATDAYVGVRGARLVLLDDTGVRATMTASWLVQMGWQDVFIWPQAPAGWVEKGPAPTRIFGLEAAGAPELDPGQVHRAVQRGEAIVVDLATSLQYLQGHIPGAHWALRTRFAASLPKLPPSLLLVLSSPDGVLAKVAAAEAKAASGRPVNVLTGGTRAWQSRGLDMAQGPEHMADTPDDVFLRPYDRAADQEAAMKQYLDWEVNLMEQIARDGDTRFHTAPAL